MKFFRIMNILQIGDNDLLCRKFAGHCLNLYLNQLGHSSKHLVWSKLSQDKKTFSIARNKTDRLELYKVSRTIRERYALDSFINPLSMDILLDPLFLDADIIHYHLIHNFIFDLNFLPIMTRLKPTIWSLHDPWALHGHCVYSQSCNKWEKHCADCPNLSTNFKLNFDNSALNYELKKQAFIQSKLEIIVASKWMENQLNRSVFFKDKKIHVVPYGIDQEIFKPIKKDLARKKLNIPTDVLVISFRCSASKFKGIDYVKHVINNIKSNRKIIFLLLDEKFTDYVPKHQYVEYGWVMNDKLLSTIYNASDLFLMPSTSEAFGVMAIEAMSCSTLPIVVDGTALPEVVNAKSCGVSTRPNKKDYLKAVQYYVDHEKERINKSNFCLQFAKKNYSKNRYVKTISQIYTQAMKNFQIDPDAEIVINQLKTHGSRFYKENDVSTLIASYESVTDIKKELCEIKSNYDRVMNRKVMKIINLYDNLKRKFKNN